MLCKFTHCSSLAFIALNVAVHFATCMGLPSIRHASQHVALFADKSAKSDSRSRSGPATLGEYCSGEDAGFHKDDGVLANWRHYGGWYPGKVVAEHGSDGTIDILYDDGWTEDRMKSSDVKPLEGAEKKKANTPKDDAACELAADLKQVKKKTMDVQENLASWMVNERATMAKLKGVTAAVETQTTTTALAFAAPAPAPFLAASPAPAVAEASTTSEPKELSAADKLKMEELEALKKTLAGVDAQIMKIKSQMSANDFALKVVQEDKDLPNEPKTIDDLIEEYQRRIAERERQLAELLVRLKEQERGMAIAGLANIKLEDIAIQVSELSADVERIQLKGEELERDGRLDAELAAMVAHVVRQNRKLQESVSALIEAQKRAEEARKAREAERVARDKAREARQAARSRSSEHSREHSKSTRKAEEDSQAEITSMEEEGDHAQTNRKELENQLQDEQAVFAAATAVEDDVNEVAVQTEKLDTGVHPHGEKWWRYRYEHSFVEAWLMVFITIFMWIWETIVKWGKRRIYTLSHLNINDSLQHGTMYIHWFESSMIELASALLVFLTAWVLVQIHFFEFVTRHIHGNDSMRMPNQEVEYRHLLFDLCVVLFFAILFFFSLSLSVVKAATDKLFKWAKLENEAPDDETLVGQAPTGSVTMAALRRQVTMATTRSDYCKLKGYFMFKMRNFLETTDDLIFWKYLRVNVRRTVDCTYSFGPWVWGPIVITFGIFCFLHGFFHMGYIRIMFFFCVVLLVNVAAMAYVIVTVNQKTEQNINHSQDLTPRGEPEVEHHASHLDALTSSGDAKWVVSFLLHYNTFFLCYGAARAVCQPWMWELHFKMTCVVLSMTLCISLLFVFMIAPMIPTFAASLALPPYTDRADVMKMKDMVKTETSSKEFVAN